jgi:hypothetical protein
MTHPRERGTGFAGFIGYPEGATSPEGAGLAKNDVCPEETVCTGDMGKMGKS